MGRDYSRMVMRTKIKEIIATGRKFGMRGDFSFFLVGLVAGLLFILNSSISRELRLLG